MVLAAGFYTAVEFLHVGGVASSDSTIDDPPPTEPPPPTGTTPATAPPPPTGTTPVTETTDTTDTTPVTGTTGTTDTTPVTGTTGTNPVDAALDGLRRASIAFNAPSTLELHEQADIELFVSAGQSIAELKKQITAEGDKEGARIEVSDTMIATLTGLGFSIQQNSPTEQPVATKRPTTWSWTIEPTRTGTQHLTLTLSAVITVNGREKPYNVEQFRRDLTVDVTWSERLSGFFKNNWQWLWTALLVPIGGLLWHRHNNQNKAKNMRKKKQRKRSESVKPER